MLERPKARVCPWASKFANHLSYRLAFSQFYWPALRVAAIRAHRPTEFEDRPVPVCNHLAQAGHNNSQLYHFSPCRLSFNTA
jgi:hypothetical protein